MYKYPIPTFLQPLQTTNFCEFCSRRMCKKTLWKKLLDFYMVILCVHFTLLQAMAEEKKINPYLCGMKRWKEKKNTFQNN